MELKYYDCDYFSFFSLKEIPYLKMMYPQFDYNTPDIIFNSEAIVVDNGVISVHEGEIIKIVYTFSPIEYLNNNSKNLVLLPNSNGNIKFIYYATVGRPIPIEHWEVKGENVWEIEEEYDEQNRVINRWKLFNGNYILKYKENLFWIERGEDVNQSIVVLKEETTPINVCIFGKFKEIDGIKGINSINLISGKFILSPNLGFLKCSYEDNNNLIILNVDLPTTFYYNQQKQYFYNYPIIALNGKCLNIGIDFDKYYIDVLPKNLYIPNIEVNDFEYNIYLLDDYYTYNRILNNGINLEEYNNIPSRKKCYIQIDITKIQTIGFIESTSWKKSIPILIYENETNQSVVLTISNITFNSISNYDFTKFIATVEYTINGELKTIQVPFYDYTIRPEVPFKFLISPYKVYSKKNSNSEGVFQIENGIKNVTFVSNNVNLNSSETFLDKIQEKKSEGDLQFDAILINPSDSSDIHIADNEGNNLDNTKTYEWDNGVVKKIDLGIEFLKVDGKLIPVVSDIEMFKQTSKNVSNKPIPDLKVSENLYWGWLYWDKVPVIANENLKKVINGEL